MHSVTILGATGSIGRQTLAVIQLHPDRFHVFALTGYRNMALLYEQCKAFKPTFAVVDSQEQQQALTERLVACELNTTVLAGAQALADVASDAAVDTVVSALVGAAGLLPTLSAIQADKRVLLANKEVLVMAGSLVMDALSNSQAQLLPVDSEHNAALQCFPDDCLPGTSTCPPAHLKQLILTASGGPFYAMPLSELRKVTADQALNHPNWSMGAKVSIDSATMMNKAFEVIEASWLFGLPAEMISVWVHRQSIVHALAQYEDGSLIAHMAAPDMRVPIANALAYPNRMESGVGSIDCQMLSNMTFEPVDKARYPALGLAYEVLSVGGNAGVLLNAANEEAVCAFLAGQISFDRIAQINVDTLARVDSAPVESMEAILHFDQAARAVARKLID